MFEKNYVFLKRNNNKMTNTWNENLEHQNRSNIHVGGQMELFKTDSMGFQSSTDIVMPPLNQWAGFYRQKPKSSLANSTLFQALSQTEYEVSVVGYTMKMMLELTLSNSSGGTINVLPHFLIDRVELYTSSGNIFDTIYGSNIYFNKIYQSYELCKRLAPIEGFNLSTYGGVPLTAGQQQVFTLHIPSILDQNLKMNIIDNRMLVRVYWSPLGTDTPASLYCANADIITQGFLLSGSHEAKETKAKKSKILRTRFLQPVRASQESIQLSPSGQFDIRLTSGSGISSHLVIFIRTNPQSYANVNTFIPINSLELLDRNSTIVGINFTDANLRFIASQTFPGDIINQVPGLYIIPFTISAEASNSG